MTKNEKKVQAPQQGGSVFERKRALAAKRTRRRRRVIAAVCALLLLGVVGAGAFWYLNFASGDGTTGRFYNPNADLGQLDGKTPEEITAELNRVVEEGMFNISIAEVLRFPDGTSEGDVRIENVPGNRYLMDVTVTLEETGEVVYESGVLEPNHHITRGTLSVDLDKGTYPAIAAFSALDPETEALVGQANAEVTIMVEG